MARILVVDDEDGLRAMLEVVLRRDGHRVATAANAAEALALLAAEPAPGFEAMLTDLRMDGGDGLELLAQVRARHHDVFVILMTAFAQWDTAVRAMRLGAYDVLRKPFENQTARTVVNRALAARDRYLAAKGAGEHLASAHLIGSSPAIEAVQQLIVQVGSTDSTVLVTGESGTGKELVARAIHYASLRADGPLVRINSGALTPSLLESELFGHTKGSFTGAIEDRPGLFALADRGTLFLDEVGELAPETQVKLLRVLETGEYSAVGGREVRRCDVRVVAATNRDLGKMVQAGTFREDLFYRLAVIPIHLPPLRERREDIPLLAGHLLARHAVKLRRGITGYSREAIEAMLRHAWPGNVRELDNRIQRGVALCGGTEIGPELLFADLLGSGVHRVIGAAAPVTPAPAALPTAEGEPATLLPDLLRQLAAGEAIDLERSAARAERLLVEGALQRTGDNLTEAARLLGLSFRQMRYKVRQLGLR